MRTSYHNHSRWSDGEGEIADFVRAAGGFGLDEVGMSDHYVLHPSGREIEWSIPVDMLDAYVDAVRSASGEAVEKPLVRLGIEMDFFPEREDVTREVLARYPFDYVIGSVHFFDGFPIDEAAERWDVLDVREKDDIIRGYWLRIRQMAESGLFDIAGHLDLTKKFGHRASVDLSSEISAALDAILASSMVVELNTAGSRVPASEQYPSREILQGCFHRGIPTVVTADAHTPENLTRDYPRAYSLLREIGYTELVSFANRRRLDRPLP